jgi:hypothetical protein
MINTKPGKTIMSCNEFKNILENLLVRSSITSPLKSQIQISIDITKKIVALSIPVFSPFGPMPKSISSYVSKRQGLQFKPHATRFEENEGKIHLIQEIAFYSSPQDSLRRHVANFWTMTQSCHKMLKEIALEEKTQKFAPEFFN